MVFKGYRGGFCISCFGSPGQLHACGIDVRIRVGALGRRAVATAHVVAAVVERELDPSRTFHDRSSP